jgi:uracil-DNA glycosylase family protein
VTAADFLPEERSLPKLREAASGCQGCQLYRDATQTVFGEGSAAAELVLVGEVPGDREDIEGKPFVGPAGRLLNEALQEVGLDPKLVYITNVVKHFKFERRGRRRIHRKPSAEEIRACFPWLEAELEVLRPRALVCLGATASQALLGRQFRVSRDRGKLLQSELAPVVMATVHPSSILRAPDEATRRIERERFVDDLRVLAGEIREAS